ncbi:MAG: lysophospholipid acyltransferase family protein [Brevefilum sp.]
MKQETYSLKYPRHVLLRKSMIGLGKILLALLTNVEINGRERLPKKGPVILAGNHVAVMEAVLMAVYTPGMVEFVGTGDIPFDPNYAFIANTYDLIPVNRGNIDRKGLQMGLDVLAQDGILGIFPEGGTWDPAKMHAQTGVALLSYRAGVPVIPVGFGGIRGALKKALNFKHPRLVMNVGQPIAPVTLQNPSLPMKTNLERAANQIMSEINALVPDEDLNFFRRRVDETYQLDIEVLNHQSTLPVPEHLRVHHGQAYAHFLFIPNLMDVLVRNLHLPLKPLRSVYRQDELSPVLRAWDAILDYLKENPGYFTYRFGVEEGLSVKQALLELKKLAEWAQESGFRLTIKPIRKYRNANTGARVIERGGCFPESM